MVKPSLEKLKVGREYIPLTATDRLAVPPHSCRRRFPIIVTSQGRVWGDSRLAMSTYLHL